MTQTLTLALDASTYSGTVVLLCGDAELGASEVAMRNAGRETLLPAIADLFQRTGATVADVERVVCGSGPGSFTGLRIAASIAKALALGARSDGKPIPFFGVSSLLLIVAGNDIARRPGRYMAVLDALRGDMYAATYEVREGLEIAEIEGMSVEPRDDIGAHAARLGSKLAGPEQPLRLSPHARGVARLQAMLDAAAPSDLASWEPNYGRPPAAEQRRVEAGRRMSSHR